MLGRFLLLSLMLATVSSIKVFLMGGAMQDSLKSVYDTFARQTNRTPQPNKCDLNWDTTKCPRIAIVTSAAENQAAGNDAYSVDAPSSLSYEHLYMLYGFAPKHISVHVDNYAETTNPGTPRGAITKQILETCDAVFFNGGDQSRHARCWLQDDGTPNSLFSIVKTRAMNDEIVLAGTSAGTAIMGPLTYGEGSAFGMLYFANQAGLALKKVSDGGPNGSGLRDTRNGTSGLQYQQNGGYMAGFGLVPFLTDTHFDARARALRIPSVLYQLKYKIGVGVSEATCLYYKNGKGLILGLNGAYIVNISQADNIRRPYFTMNGVKVNYLSDGDSIDMESGVVRSAKNLINTPRYQSFYDSKDLTKSYQITTSLTHLVDQKPGYNIGETARPRDYPTSTPTFQMRFYRDNMTKGYFDGVHPNYYTAEAVQLNYTYNVNVVESRRNLKLEDSERTEVMLTEE